VSSPFADFLRNLRQRNGYRQHELAALLGYEQSYVSALELGVRPPSEEFLGMLRKHVPLGGTDLAALERSVKMSGRRFVLPVDVPTDTYLFCHELWEKLEGLHPAVIQAMRDLIKLENAIAEQPVARPGRLHRKTNQNREAKM